MTMFFRILLLSILWLPLTATAADFDWMDDFNAQLRLGQSGWHLKLQKAFSLNKGQVEGVIKLTDSPAAAFTVMAMSDISGVSVDSALNAYRANKGKGWGVLAKSLGIKPGSRQFKALKSGAYVRNKGFLQVSVNLGGSSGPGKGNKGKGKN